MGLQDRSTRTPDGLEAIGRGAMQPPVAYLPCRLDEDGALDEVLLVELADGRIALLGYTALDRFVAACGDAHPWVLWRTERLPDLHALRPYDVAYLDVALPAVMRRDGADPVDTAEAKR